MRSIDAYCPQCGVSLQHMPPVQATPPPAGGPDQRAGITVFWRFVAFLVSIAQAWWRRFLLANGAGKLFWGLVPLVGGCMFCSIAAAPFTEPPATATPRVAVASTSVQPTRARSDAEVIASIAAAEPTALPTAQATSAPAPPPATDAAALLPPVEPTAQPAATEPPAPSPTPTILETAAPTPEPAGPPRIVAPQAANVRDQPTAAGSTVIGTVTAGESLTLRRVTPDGTWYA
ncbi:MAG TPA: hypothetical protein VLA19_28600, partial [Herpetosiphonaceae bacterium]|nr:hypothetical protein [Herpetosiphonaceae bacterium]